MSLYGQSGYFDERMHPREKEYLMEDMRRRMATDISKQIARTMKVESFHSPYTGQTEMRMTASTPENPGPPWVGVDPRLMGGNTRVGPGAFSSMWREGEPGDPEWNGVKALPKKLNWKQELRKEIKDWLD